MMSLYEDTIHATWQPLFQAAWKKVDENYKINLYKNTDWLPGPQQIFNAFSLPLPKVQYILFGESPYPRIESANGYAFWDGKVKELWSETGLSKTVNRATSLRNIIKMLLIVEGLLSQEDLTQSKIATLNKGSLVKTGEALFNNFLKAGFLLLNATPVLSKRPVRQEASFWHPFIRELLLGLSKEAPHIKLILFGKIAATINTIPESHLFKQMCTEHPYNLSFINNPKILQFFKPLHLLLKP